MSKISSITSLRQVDYCVWHVIFQMEQHPLEFATDFLFIVKENKWVVNSLITHELTSLMKGHTCSYCGETKIACFVSSHHFRTIKQEIIEHEFFRTNVSDELKLDIETISTELLVVNKKSKWDELASENRFYGNLLRIKNRQIEKNS